MLHGIEFAGTKREPSYRNRWVRTQAWATHNKVDQPETFPATNPNVNLVNHGAELLALAEGAAPVAVDTQLNSLGPATNHPGQR